MEIFKTRIEDCILFKPAVFEDERGFFYEGFNRQRLLDTTGIDFGIKQINQSKSSKGVLRGLHFQLPPFAQAKLVSVIEGKVLDVAVDLRQGSKTFGQYEKVLLTGDNKHHFFIPEGFAHGFVVLSETARFMYGVNNYYSPQHDGGIYYSDKDIDIDWEISETLILTSEKDKKLPLLKDFASPW